MEALGAKMPKFQIGQVADHISMAAIYPAQMSSCNTNVKRYILPCSAFSAQNLALINKLGVSGMLRFISLIVTCTALALPAAAQDATRALHHVAGDVYLFQNNFHLSLVVPTSEGTVRVDPINAEAGKWLNENLTQITDQPVTHLIYSHSH
ncbi:MAG: hypothetical protein GTO37_13865, partial [Planctomycetales bacterium]|nr:hypothetical protein [Planctomycetales bacterium]